MSKKNNFTHNYTFGGKKLNQYSLYYLFHIKSWIALPNNHIYND